MKKTSNFVNFRILGCVYCMDVENVLVHLLARFGIPSPHQHQHTLTQSLSMFRVPSQYEHQQPNKH